jgi:hypothetical protein
MALSRTFEAHSVLLEQGACMCTRLPPYPDQCIMQCLKPSHGTDAFMHGHNTSCQLWSSKAHPWHGVELGAHATRRLSHTCKLRQRQLQSICAANMKLTAKMSASAKELGLDYLTPYEANAVLQDESFTEHMEDLTMFREAVKRRQTAAIVAPQFFSWLQTVAKMAADEREQCQQSAEMQASPRGCRQEPLHIPDTHFFCNSAELQEVCITALHVC